MRSRTVSFALAFACIASAISLGQTKEQTSPLARISYNGNLPPKICFTVYKDGTYLLSRRASLVIPIKPDDTDHGEDLVRGMLSKDDLEHVTALLRNIRSNAGPGGPVLEGAEWFIAEVGQEKSTKRYIWVDADHRDPFPGSIRKLVGWLQDFKAKDSSVFTLHDLSSVSVCPSMSDDSLQPIIANWVQRPGASSCGAR